MGFGALALALPQAPQAYGGAEFEGLRLLLTRHVEGMLKTRRGFVLIPTALGCVALGFADEQQSLSWSALLPGRPSRFPAGPGGHTPPPIGSENAAVGIPPRSSGTRRAPAVSAPGLRDCAPGRLWPS